jgi:uncharacterized protein (TIGR00369 family)
VSEELPPYADFLGIRGHDGVTLVMPHDGNSGRPGFLHGGAISGLLEIAAVVALRQALAGEGRIKPVNVTVDFTRGGRERDTFARGTVTRLGNRVANVEAVAWQDDPDRPIAGARMTYLIVRPSSTA